MHWEKYIVVNEKILGGKPTLINTRISVEFVLGLLSKGWKENDIFESYPQISSDHMKAVFQFALECLQDDKFFYLKKVV